MLIARAGGRGAAIPGLRPIVPVVAVLADLLMMAPVVRPTLAQAGLVTMVQAGRVIRDPAVMEGAVPAFVFPDVRVGMN